MDTNLLNKVLKEIKNQLKLDYALNKGFICPSCTTKMIEETYGLNATGIYVRWFGEDQDQLSITQFDKLYINHDFGNERDKNRGKEVIEILEKYYIVDWDCSDKKTILIVEKEKSKND